MRIITRLCLFESPGPGFEFPGEHEAYPETTPGQSHAGQLQDQPDFLERKTKFTIVLPLVRTYIYNPDYVTQSEVINAAIECLGAIAASHSFKDYRSMLIGKSKIIYFILCGIQSSVTSLIQSST